MPRLQMVRRFIGCRYSKDAMTKKNIFDARTVRTRVVPLLHSPRARQNHESEGTVRIQYRRRLRTRELHKEFDRAGEPKLMDDESAQARGHRSCSQRGAPADGEWTAWRRRPARRQFDG